MKKQLANDHLQDRLNKAKEFIKVSYPGEISLTDISSVACLQKHYFLREFKKKFNITPWKFLQDTRLQQAHRLLETTNGRIHDICAEVGFRDSGSFGRLFKERFGYTPGSVKRQMITEIERGDGNFRSDNYRD